MNLKSLINKLKSPAKEKKEQLKGNIKLRDTFPIIGLDPLSRFLILPDSVSRAVVLTITPTIEIGSVITDALNDFYSTIPYKALNDGSWVIQEYLYTEEINGIRYSKCKMFIYRKVQSKDLKDDGYDASSELGEHIDSLERALNDIGIPYYYDSFLEILEWFSMFNEGQKQNLDLDEDSIFDEISHSVFSTNLVPSSSENCFKSDRDNFHRFLRFSGIRKLPKNGQWSNPIAFTERSYPRYINALENMGMNNIVVRMIVFSKPESGEDKILSSSGVYLREASIEKINIEQRNVTSLMARHGINILKDNHDGLSLNSFLIHLPLVLNAEQDVKGNYLRPMYLTHGAQLSLIHGSSTGYVKGADLDMITDSGYQISLKLESKKSIVLTKEAGTFNDEKISYDTLIQSGSYTTSLQDSKENIALLTEKIISMDVGESLSELIGTQVLSRELEYVYDSNSPVSFLATLYHYLNEKCLRDNANDQNTKNKIVVNADLWSNEYLERHITSVIASLLNNSHQCILFLSHCTSELIELTDYIFIEGQFDKPFKCFSDLQPLINCVNNDRGALLIDSNVYFYKTTNKDLNRA